MTGLQGWFHFIYSGVWHLEADRVFHVCLANSPMAVFEVLRDSGWSLQDIAITDIVWCMAYKGRVGWGAYIAQKPCNSIAIG